MYLDSDSIVQYDLYNKTKHLDMSLPMYAPKCNKESKIKGKNFVIRYKSIINCDYNFNELVEKIDGENYCFMGHHLLLIVKNGKIFTLELLIF